MDDWMFIDNSGDNYEVIAFKNLTEEKVLNNIVWSNIRN